MMIKVSALLHRVSLLLITLLAASAWSTAATAAVITGRVVSVADGDTITVLVGGHRQVKIRLADVDTPEKKQPWGERSKQATSNLVFGRQVTVRILKQDRYGRSVGRVTVDGKNVGRELVRSGNAWVYRKYSRDPELLALEQQARDQHIGLWALPPAQQVPPWEWRRQARSPYIPGVWSGKVVAVADGDTATVLAPGKHQIKIRFAGIDAPEKGAPWGNRAKQALAALVFGRQVRVTVLKQDKYGRSVARISVAGKDVGRELVRTGNAWVYRKYSNDPILLALEQQARDQRRGLWALPAAQRVPPWEWRHAKRDRAKQTKAAASGAADTRCGTKHYCSQMISCAEARMYLTQCGVSTLDGNSDGVPCNKLCKEPSHQRHQ